MGILVWSEDLDRDYCYCFLLRVTVEAKIFKKVSNRYINLRLKCQSSLTEKSLEEAAAIHRKEEGEVVKTFWNIIEWFFLIVHYELVSH